ncbi:MAG: serine hydrolase, partial [Myxococcota bacterium]|nr:serine hydrolase [Myxococcota bacterium]
VRERAFDWKGSSDDVEGWNPASTVKLFAAIAALQRIDEQGFSPAAQVTFQGKRSRTHSVKELLDAAIVKSDNLAYNRLVQLAGFDRLNGAFLNERNGIRNSALSRAYEQSEWLKLGESASFRNAPAISFSEGKRSALREASSGSYAPFCSRAACTTLQDLAEAMRRVMLQEYLPQHQSFELSPDSLAILRRALRAERARGNEVVDAFSAVFADGDVQFYSKPGYSEGWYSDTVFISDPHRRQAWVVAMAGYPGRHSLDEAARTVATLLATGQLAEYER